ncbi:MAG: LysO family transporter [Candidatus Cloacimonetes bacterium]|nr:LysO family transporter [Candidatus Cloacimonadota bacterium]MCF7813805.1 LysO family transporter [Candidatus Cloacimonadota bacterium]MCF7868484.1 LysO family transporter [Candidatus Cloacimonadota bacterium]
MLIVLLFLAAGIFAGHLLKQKKNIILLSNKLLMLSIFLLLFLLGVEVGKNQTILSNFADIGIKAILISLSGIFSSVFLSMFVYRIFFRKKDEE